MNEDHRAGTDAAFLEKVMRYEVGATRAQVAHRYASPEIQRLLRETGLL